MNSLASIVEQRTPLFAHISIPRRSAVSSIRPILPNKIRFIWNPNAQQILNPGLYFEIPDTLSTSEMEILEYAIFRVLQKTPRRLSAPLDIPASLGRRLSSASAPVLNGFEQRGGRTYIASANCVFVAPDQSLYPTSIQNPEYGVVVPLMEAACCLAFISASVSLDMCESKGTRLVMLERTWKKLVSAVKPSVVKNTQLVDGVLRVGNVSFNQFADEGLLVPGVSALLCSFFWLETDLSKFLEW